MPHLGAATRAAATGVPGGDDVAGVHAAFGDGGLQGGLQGAVETVSVPTLQAAGAGCGRDLRLPEDLIGQQVPDSGDLGLIEQAGLDRDRALGDQAAEFRGRDLLGVRPERVDAGIQPDAPQSAFVEQHEGAAVGEVEGEPVPLGLARLCVAADGAAALDRVAALGRNDDAAAHPEVQTQVGARLG